MHPSTIKSSFNIYSDAISDDETDLRPFYKDSTYQAYADVKTLKICINALQETRNQIAHRLDIDPLDTYEGQLYVNEELLDSLDENILYLRDDIHTIETLAGI